MEASIQLSFTAGSTTYDINLSIPDDVSAENPYTFTVKDGDDNLLDLAYADTNNYSVALQPPSDVLPSEVDKLAVEIKEGTVGDTGGGGENPGDA